MLFYHRNSLRLLRCCTYLREACWQTFCAIGNGKEYSLVMTTIIIDFLKWINHPYQKKYIFVFVMDTSWLSFFTLFFSFFLQKYPKSKPPYFTRYLSFQPCGGLYLFRLKCQLQQGYIVTLVLKGLMCSFIEWNIQPFNTKVTILHRNRLRFLLVTQSILNWPTSRKLLCF